MLDQDWFQLSEAADEHILNGEYETAIQKYEASNRLNLYEYGTISSVNANNRGIACAYAYAGNIRQAKEWLFSDRCREEDGLHMKDYHYLLALAEIDRSEGRTEEARQSLWSVISLLQKWERLIIADRDETDHAKKVIGRGRRVIDLAKQRLGPTG